jgi:hypothetical protein
MDGRAKLFLLGDELLNVAKLERMAQIYATSEEMAGGYFAVVQELRWRLEEEVREQLAQEAQSDKGDIDDAAVDEAIAERLGIPLSTLAKALAWEPPTDKSEGEEGLEGLFAALDTAAGETAEALEE